MDSESGTVASTRLLVPDLLVVILGSGYERLGGADPPVQHLDPHPHSQHVYAVHIRVLPPVVWAAAGWRGHTEHAHLADFANVVLVV
jgi:hypothetical protein